MTVVINGTTGISGVDGSAGTPAVQGTDTNTGVFYPAADTVGVSTGGSERMRVDSSGNVGIGTSTAGSKLTVLGTSSIYASTNANTGSGYLLSVTGGNSKSSSTDNTNFALFSNDALASNPLSLAMSVVGNATVANGYAYLQASEYGTGNYRSIALNPSGGNVGIGQTSQVWDEKLGVRLATSGSGTVGLGVYSASTTYASSMIRVQAETGGSGWKMYEGRANGGSQLFWVDGSGGAYFAGNVGIGTSSPGAKLDVRGSSTFLVNATNPTAWVSVDSALTTGSMYNQWNTSSNVGISGTYTNHPYTFVTNNTERMRLDTSGNLLFNSGYGSVATAYGCRAWVNFNGTGVVAIRASGNVTSITDNGTGDYTVNFTTAMTDANYSVSATSDRASSGVNGGMFNVLASTTPTTSAVRLITFQVSVGVYDPTYANVSVFR